MTEFNSEPEPMDGKQLKKDYRKFVGAFLALIFLVAGAYIAWKIYDYNRAPAALRELEQALREARDADYRRMMADIYGGKTPQETLQMYIDAVEAGDYELASKYFVEEGREKELRSFDGATKADVKSYLEPLKESAGQAGYLNMQGDSFVIDKPVYIRLILYPNGIWKITEI